jgi:copper chaperone CopZ
MKRILVIVMLALSVPAFSQIKSASLTASGLTCSMCSKAIYKALLKVPSIKDVQVDIKNSKYSIEFKEDAVVVLDDVKKAVEDAGFSVASLQVKANFQNVTLKDGTHVSLGGSTFLFVGVSKRTLNGDQTFTIIDKNYLSAKEVKKMSKLTKTKSAEAGSIVSGTPSTTPDGRIYHATM